MTTCRHANLLLLAENKNRLRCTHCHLTIKAEEIGGDYCPECYESQGKRRYDFEEVKNEGAVRYRCEECGAMIELDRSKRET